MKVTQELARVFHDAPGLLEEGLQAVLDHLKAEGLLVEPFDPAAWDGETEPLVGYRAVDRSADVWCRGDTGWGTLVDGAGFGGSILWRDVQPYGPFALVPGGPVPREDW